MTELRFSTRITIDDAGLDDAELEKYSGAIGRLIEAEFQRVMGFAFPPMPTTIEYQKPPSCGCGMIYHRADCRFSCS